MTYVLFRQKESQDLIHSQIADIYHSKKELTEGIKFRMINLKDHFSIYEFKKIGRLCRVNRDCPANRKLFDAMQNQIRQGKDPEIVYATYGARLKKRIGLILDKKIRNKIKNK